jgi:Fuc2NAc and GlcNAc transferase
VSLVEAVILLATFCASLLGSRVMRRYALRRKLLDVPNDRSSHAVPTPRGGGLAIVLSFFAATSALVILSLLDGHAMLALLAGGAIAAVGFLDDHWQVSAKWRFAVHLAAAIFVVAVLGAIRLPIFRGLGPGAYWLSALFTVFAFAWATNLFNFMDGIDGLAASEAVFMSAGGAILNYANAGDAGLTASMASLSAATLGFSFWNWPPARLFMGDVGSGFLGFTLTVLALLSSQRGGVTVAAWAILGGVFLVDASLTLVRRMLRGDRWSEPHRTHAYQRLARRWSAHLPVTLLAGAINVVWLLPWAWYAAHYPERAPFCVVTAMLPLLALAFFAGSGKPETTNTRAFER